MSFVGDRKMMKEHSSDYFALIAFPDFGLSIGKFSNQHINYIILENNYM